jgi:hypothetical protein
MCHIIVGIEESDDAAQHFPHLFKAGARRFDTQPRDLNHGGW